MTIFFETSIVEARNEHIVFALIDTGLQGHESVFVAVCARETAAALHENLGSALKTRLNQR